MHNVLLSVWMGLRTGQGHRYFYLLVFPMALWEFFLALICGTALKVHQNPAMEVEMKKIFNGQKSSFDLEWSVFLFVCLFLADGLVLTHPTQHIQTGLARIQLLTTVQIRTTVCNEPRRAWPNLNVLQEFQQAPTRTPCTKARLEPQF